MVKNAQEAELGLSGCGILAVLEADLVDLVCLADDSQEAELGLSSLDGPIVSEVD